MLSAKQNHSGYRHGPQSGAVALPTGNLLTCYIRMYRMDIVDAKGRVKKGDAINKEKGSDEVILTVLKNVV